MPDGSVFFVLGAQQAVAVPLLLDEAPGTVTIFRLAGTPLELPDPTSCEQIVLPQSGGSLATLGSYRAAVRRLRALRRECRELHVYVPHLFHALANFAALGLKPDQVHLLPDGVLNYYDPQVDADRRRQMRVKQLVMTLCGASYRPYDGGLTGAGEVRFRSTFTFSEDGLRTRHGDIRTLTLAGAEAAAEGNTVLFVDQPLHTLQRELREGIEQQVIRYLADRRVLYKAHVSQDRPSVPMPDDVEILPRERPVETLVGNLPIGEVVSVSSSALLTLKQLNPALRCTAVGIELLSREKPEVARVRDTMRAAGIHCL